MQGDHNHPLNKFDICIDNVNNIYYNVSVINTRKRVLPMAQTNLTIRIDEDLKRDAETLFNRIGLNMSSAINVFFRQAVGAQAIPFELKVYDEYYTGKNLARLKHSIAQSDQGKTISFTMEELEAMESGDIPQRALDFLASHKGESAND